MPPILKDSGHRQSFDSGSVRDTDAGKGRPDLLSPIALDELARHMQDGCEKYGERNWEKGQDLQRYLASALRHLNKFREGHRDEPHMRAAFWNIHSFIHTAAMIERGLLPKELDNLVGYLPEEVDSAD